LAENLSVSAKTLSVLLSFYFKVHTSGIRTDYSKDYIHLCEIIWTNSSVYLKKVRLRHIGNHKARSKGKK